MLAKYETKDYWLRARSGRQTLRSIRLRNREKVVMFMFGGNQDELVQERASRIKSSIWILWCQDYRARNPLGMGSRLSGTAAQSAHGPWNVSLFYLHWTCEPGSRGSASLPLAMAGHVLIAGEPRSS